MRHRSLWIGLVIPACALVWSACGGKQAGPSGPSGTAGTFKVWTNEQGRTDFTLTMLDGNTVELGKLVGKPVVLHFWGTW